MTSISSCFYGVKRTCFGVLGYMPLAAILVGCDAPGTARLKELCENEGFPKVYQQVSADGYYDDVRECGYAIRFLASSDYSYLECRQSREMPGGIKPLGDYRISKQDQASGLCDDGLLKMVKSQPFRYEEILDSGMCFSLKPLSGFTSVYGLFREKGNVLELGNIFGSIISVNSMYIKNIVNGDLVAEDKSFSLYPTPGITISSFQRMLHCNTVVPRNRGVPPLNAVDSYIKPKMTNRESSHGNNRGALSSSVTR